MHRSLGEAGRCPAPATSMGSQHSLPCAVGLEQTMGRDPYGLGSTPNRAPETQAEVASRAGATPGDHSPGNRMTGQRLQCLSLA